jgi:hypothetical protein
VAPPKASPAQQERGDERHKEGDAGTGQKCDGCAAEASERFWLEARGPGSRANDPPRARTVVETGHAGSQGFMRLLGLLMRVYVRVCVRVFG